MLANKSIGAGGLVGAGGGSGIGFVGRAQYGFSGTSTSKIYPLTSSLVTGDYGPYGQLEEGDMVIAFFSSGSTRNRYLQVSGYTLINDLYGNDSYDVNFTIAYKFMGATPDTSITLPTGTQSTADAGVLIVFAFRGVDPTNPFDGTTYSIVGNNSLLPNPLPIVPSVTGAVIVAAGASGHRRGSVYLYSSDFDKFTSYRANDSNDSSLGVGFKRWVSGTFDPAQFTASTSNNTAAAWAAITMALVPLTQ